MSRAKSMAETSSEPERLEPPIRSPATDVPPPLDAVLRGDQSAWRVFVEHYHPLLRTVVQHANEASLCPLSADAIGDVLGDFWRFVIADDMRVLRKFKAERGAPLLTWLTFHVAQVAYEHIRREKEAPVFVPLHEARHVRDPRPLPEPKFRTELGATGSIDVAIRECVRSEVVSAVRAELATANRDRDREVADRPRSAAWWGEHLGCSAESLVKRAKRGSLEYVKIGARYYFTRAQIDGSRRWQRAKRGAEDGP